MVGGLIGYKVGMTQIYAEDGKLVPVTIIKAGPCQVVQVKTLEKEGYQAVQLSFDPVKGNKVTRPLRGHFKRANVAPARVLREFSGGLDEVKMGQTVTAAIFKKGDMVTVTGTSRGKGFQGVMKRHHYSGGPATHGSMFHRAPGSIGASSFPSRVWKNKGMPGHMGNRQVTVEGLEIAHISPEENLILVKGAVPGSPKALVSIRRFGKQKKVLGAGKVS